MPHIVKDQARLWSPKALKGVALLKARFKDFAYSKHVHEEFGIGVIEHGTQKFQYCGETHFAPPHAMITVNPDMIHDGQAATEAGYQYRMAYVPTEVIREVLSDVSGSTAPAGYFLHPVTLDPHVSRRLLHALWLLDQHAHSLLEVQSAFVEAIADLFARHAQPRYAPDPPRSRPAVIRKACELIRARTADDLSLEEIAREVGVSRFHFLRLFKASTGLSPHEYLVLRRLELARLLIKQGHSLVRAAHEAGFADQSHMSRRFKAAYGITPGQYQQAVTA